MMLSSFEKRWAGTIARALLPRGTLGGATDERDAGGELSRMLSRSPWWAAIVARLGLWMVWLAPLFSWPPRPFGALDEAARVATLERLFHSRAYAIRQVLVVLKLNLCMALLGERAVLARLGAYDLAEQERARSVS